MIKTPTKFIALLSGAAFLMSSAFAQGVTTDPVGYVSNEISANSDLKISVPLIPASVFSAVADSVSVGTVSTLSVVPDVLTDAHYMLVTSGVLAGDWYTVTATTASDVTVAEDLAAGGLLAADSFEVRPFWTLDTLLPSGGGVPASPDFFGPVGFVLKNDVAAAGINLAPSQIFFYHDGTLLPAGWYNQGTNLAAGDEVLSPGSYVTLRNGTGSPVDVVFSGAVPMSTVSNLVVSRSAGTQDSQIPNPYPAGMTLANTGLVTDGAMRASPDFFGPLDVLLVYSQQTTGLNPAPSSIYFYHDGTLLPAGWYDQGTNLIADSVELEVGAALVVRRGAGADEIYSWNPVLPYSL